MKKMKDIRISISTLNSKISGQKKNGEKKLEWIYAMVLM